MPGQPGFHVCSHSASSVSFTPQWHAPSARDGLAPKRAAFQPSRPTDPVRRGAHRPAHLGATPLADVFCRSPAPPARILVVALTVRRHPLDHSFRTIVHMPRTAPHCPSARTQFDILEGAPCSHPARRRMQQWLSKRRRKTASVLNVYNGLCADRGLQRSCTACLSNACLLWCPPPLVSLFSTSTLCPLCLVQDEDPPSSIEHPRRLRGRLCGLRSAFPELARVAHLPLGISATSDGGGGPSQASDSSPRPFGRRSVP